MIKLLYIYIYIYILIELPWLENLADTYMWHTEHWTAVSTLLGLISNAYRDLHHWRSNQHPQNAEAETLPLGHRSISHISNALSSSHGEMHDHGMCVCVWVCVCVCVCVFLSVCLCLSAYIGMNAYIHPSI